REAVSGTGRRAGNHAVGGACSNSKTGHTAIAWTCRHTDSTSNCAKRGQAGHTGNVAACCRETCDTWATGCEADAAVRVKAGCASTVLTAACCCEACDTAGATPGCKADAAARVKAGCASVTAGRGKAVAPAALGKTAGARALSA